MRCRKLCAIFSRTSCSNRDKTHTNDALLEILIETVVADLLQQQRMKLLERFEVFEMSIYHVEVFAGPVRRSTFHTNLTVVLTELRVLTTVSVPSAVCPPSVTDVCVYAIYSCGLLRPMIP